MDHPEDLRGHAIPPVTQYALRVTADRPIVVQFGRPDTTQSNMAYYVGIGYSEQEYSSVFAVFICWPDLFKTRPVPGSRMSWNGMQHP